MPPRNIVKKTKQVGGESSAAASKRRRIELWDPFATNFPLSAHLLNQPPPTQTTGAGLHQDEEQTADDGLISSLIPQQNFIMEYHMARMQQSVKDLWRRNLTSELNKLKDLEATLQEKEQQVVKFRDLYYSSVEKAFRLEETLRLSIEGERVSNLSAIREEEVESCLVDINSAAYRMDTKCWNCQTRPATILWFPCRHLCVCLMCGRRVKTCPMCGVHKTETLLINTPRH
ncbi:zinc finger, RING/FYVE/PHD-type [Artemisia annua]|uniref:Zinc finger, RING/FYVE/PHD-type n=1 Tax=Artemisia annua TaxID=35608 RepID=A0A2U1NTE1_ARTAN|nr:zinc finger, RING/FYVE/PHD-type [Artemisia annua]